MVARKLGFALLAAFGSVALACSSSDDSSNDFGARYCALFAPCCAQAGIGGNQQVCKLLFGSVPPKDQAAADDCIKQYEAWAKEPDWCTTFGTKPRPASCEKAYPQSPNSGSAKPGETCELDDDCAPATNGKAECHTDFDTNKSYCRVVTTAAVGEACTGTRTADYTVFTNETPGALEVPVCDTAAGSYCDQGTCAALVALGGACQNTYSCAGPGTYCSGTCKSQVPVGGSCSESSEACGSDAYCDSSSSTCSARAADGSACSSFEQCQSSYCDSDGTCKPNPLGTDLGLALFCS